MKKGLGFFEKMIDFSVKYPELSPDRVLVINMKKETFSKVLTPSRMEIIKTIKKNSPESVMQLAEQLNRPIESISRDLGVLERYGILEFVIGGKTKKPKIEKEMILIPLNY